MSVLVLARTIIFLPSSLYGAVFWILDESNAGNTQLSYCWAVLTYIPPASYGAGDAQEVGKLAQTGHWAILCHVASC